MYNKYDSLSFYYSNHFTISFSLIIIVNTWLFTESTSMAIALVPSRQKVEIHGYLSLQASMKNQYHISMKQLYLNSVFTRELTYPIFM